MNGHYFDSIYQVKFWIGIRSWDARRRLCTVGGLPGS